MKKKDIPIVKKELLKKQKNKCLICGKSFKGVKSKDICLDHNYSTWKVRGVVCRICNILEAKYYRAFVRCGGKNKGLDYKAILRGLADYVDIVDTDYIYPPKSKKRRKKNGIKKKTK